MHSALVTGAETLAETHKKFSGVVVVLGADVDPEK